MNCEVAHPLINALVDGEINDADRVLVEEHLSSCAECQSVAESMRLVDASLTEAFAPERDAARQIADRVTAMVEANVATVRPAVDDCSRAEARRVDWKSLVLALVVGFVLALAIFPPRSQHSTPESFGPIALPDKQNSDHEQSPGGQSPKGIVQPMGDSRIATLVARTGEVEFDSASGGWCVAPLANFSCPTDSKVRTAKGASCELVTSDGAVIRMDGETEVRLRSPREVELQKGQVFCRSANDGTIEVFSCGPAASPQSSGKNLWSAAGSGSGFLTAISSDGAGQVMSAAGASVDVKTASGRHELKSGQNASIVNGEVDVSSPADDIVLATSWIHPLLTQKGHDDPELSHRVDELLARIGRSKMSMLYEREIRSLGEHCVLPLIRYVQSPISQIEPGRRASAMSIVADLAPTILISELLPLLRDESPEVRYQTAKALFRLTSETQGRSPDDWRNPVAPSDAAIEAWSTWWDRNRDRYPAFDASAER